MSAQAGALGAFLGSRSPQCLDGLRFCLRLQPKAPGAEAGAGELNLRDRTSVGGQNATTPRLASSRRVLGSNCFFLVVPANPENIPETAGFGPQATVRSRHSSGRGRYSPEPSSVPPSLNSAGDRHRHLERSKSLASQVVLSAVEKNKAR